MRIVIIESTACGYRWELDTQGKRVSLFGSDGEFSTVEDCLCDVRRNVESWVGLLAPMARRSLAQIQLMFEALDDGIPRSCGTMEDIWPELFWSSGSSVMRDRPLEGGSPEESGNRARAQLATGG